MNGSSFNAPAWIGLIFTMMLSVVSATYTFAILSGRVDANTKAIAEMKQDSRTSAATLAEIKDTTTIIKTKLEILLPTNRPVELAGEVKL